MRGRSRLLLLGFALLACLTLVPPDARAEESSSGGARLSFVRAGSAGGCIAAPALEREIVRRMGRDPFTASPRQWIEAVVDFVDGVYTVQLFERDQAGKTLGSRQLRAATADCHELDDAMVLAIALIIDPSLQLGPARPGVEAPPVAAALPSATPPANEPPRPATLSVASAPRPVPKAAPRRVTHREPRAAWLAGTATVTAAAVAVHGVLPGVAPGVELVTKLPLNAGAREALRFSALYLPEVRQGSALADLGYGLTAFEAGACAALPERRLRGFACSALGVGAVHSVVHNPAPFAPGDRLWLALRLEAGLAVQLSGPLWAEVRGFDLLAAQRWNFRVRTSDGPKRAFQQSVLMPGLAFGLGLTF